MPTGYTSEIADGITFEKFVMNCARAFGALASMRDDSVDAAIPEQFEPHAYHKEHLEETQAAIKEIRGMSLETASQKANAEYQLVLEANEKAIQNAIELRGKYNAMLAQVEAWNIPTPNHWGLKEFMAEQIQQSIEFDCDTKYWHDNKPKWCYANEWLAQKRAKLLRDLEYHAEEWEKDKKRTARNNAWLKALRDSLT